MPLTARELAKLVQQMRSVQKLFFRSEPGSVERFQALQQARGLEPRVDREVQAILDDRPSLFPMKEAP